jgi:hypothetical protein
MLETANSVDEHTSSFRRRLENIGAGMEPTASQSISKESNPLVRQRSADAISSPSGQLRERTTPLHREIEAVLGLPGAIRTRDDYQDWLDRLFGLYDPPGRLLATFSEWGSFGLLMSARDHTGCLVGDLAALGVDTRVLPRSFCVALDEFGTLQPQFCADVAISAGRTFRAMLVWFVPFCTGKVGQP